MRIHFLENPMIVDFHTHIFPDGIAAATIAKLESFSPRAVAHTDGTLAGLCASMEKGGIDYSVVMPVVTRPRQFDSINEFAASNNGGKLIFFGGIHPECDELEQKVDRIAELGLRGIKLHPDYQATFADDERYIRIVRRALERGLFVLFHSGIDIGLPEIIHCTPERASALLDAVDDLNRGEPHIIFAHLGACDMPDSVMKQLVGRNCMFDTAFSMQSTPADKVVDIIRAHRADRILFATDSPWRDQRGSVEHLNSLPLTDEEKHLILGGNAARLLSL